MSSAKRAVPLLAVAMVLTLSFGCGYTPQMPTKDSSDAARTRFKDVLVYDNSENLTGSHYGDVLPGTKIGDIVTIDRPGRSITRMEFLLSAWGGDDDVVRCIGRVQLRSPGRTPDRPGPPFWQGPYQRIVLPRGVDTPVVFELPGVRVPQTFVWTLSFALFDALGEAPEVAYAGPATLGDDDPGEPGYWLYWPWWPGPGWGFSTSHDTSFYCRIYADRFPGKR